jgi:hypothetical protein
MDRTYLGAYLTYQYVPLVTTAGVTATDTVGGYGPALDSVMRLLGLDPTDANPTIPPSQEYDALLLTRYFTLQWLLQAFAMQVDMADRDLKLSGSQRFKQVLALLESALAQVPSQYAIEGGDFAFGRLQLDMLEPAAFLAGGPPFPYW